MSYQPSQELLDKYADVLINFALNGGKGVKKGEVVFLQVSEVAKPILISLRRAVLQAGAIPIIEYAPDDMAREYFELATDEQLQFFPDKYLKGKVDEADHFVAIISETDKHELEGIDPQKIMMRSKAFEQYKNWRVEKENRGEMTWTLALYGTQAMADEAGLSLEEYWEQIIQGCYLDHANPRQRWEEIQEEIDRVKAKLDALAMRKVRVVAQDTDLVIGLGANRQWLGGSGRNIPSFELFVTPDWRMTEGHIYFNQPLYRYGNLIQGIRLWFENGVVVKAAAEKGEDVLKEMIATENADKIGEFSLTDGRMSRITKFMAETLFDENMGGEFGNTHLALGMGYKDCFTGDPAQVTKEQWEEMGYNDSVVHTDIISTLDRVVTATLEDGSEKVIYENGQFNV